MTPPRRGKSRGDSKPGPRGLATGETDERRYPRKILDQPQWLDCEGVGCELRGQITVIGHGGVFIRTRHIYPVGRALGLRIRTGKDWLDAVCVIRSNEDNGMGIEFMPPRMRLASRLAELI